MNDITKAERNRHLADAWRIVKLNADGGITRDSYAEAEALLSGRGLSTDRVQRYIALVMRRKRAPRYFRDGDASNPFEEVRP
jgi:hypothetical protein